MSIIGTYSVSGYEATTHTNEYSTINELLLQIQDNNTNEINAENIRNSVYTVWNKYIRGTNYIVAKANGTFIENAAELITLYNEAKTMTPGGSALSNTNRYTIFLPPGKYDFRNDIFTPNSSYIDFISLSGKADVDIITNDPIALLIKANDIYVKGINVGDKRILLEDYPLVVCENCKGGNESFNGAGSKISKLSSTFINCIGGEKSFGYNCSITGVFKNCVASNYSFGYLDVGSAYMQYAVFDKCVAGNYSFGHGYHGTYETINFCTFTDCVAGDYSFAIKVKNVNSTWRNCTGGNKCFGSTTTPSGGIYENCVAGSESFGNSAEGTYRNCKASNNSFGKGAFGIKGNLYFCIMTGSDYDFSGGGKAYSSVDDSSFWAGVSSLPLAGITAVTDDFALAGGTYSFVNGILVTFTPNL